MTARVAIAANTVWYVANFRLSLAKALRSAGYEVIAIAPPGPAASRIEAGGIRFVPLPMENIGTNPVKDMGLFLRIFETLRGERPDVYLGYTVKPNVYGGLACRLMGIPSVHNIAGLGTIFIQETWLTQIVQWLYREGLRSSAKVFFQNRDDLKLFVQRSLAPRDRVECLPGSGVNLERFMPVPVADEGERPFRFLLSARLLWDKGVGEYVEAARMVILEGREVEFQLLGFLDVENRTAIPRNQVEAWEREDLVRYLGVVDDVRPIVAQSDCVVLPSYYREGVPRSLLEAASMGKPIITTNSVGCREAVDDGVNGFLCKPRDSSDLATKMMLMMGLSADERAEMGRLGREKMVREFDERIVIDRYLAVVKECVERGRR